MNIRTETTFANNETKVMLDAKDLLLVLLCDSNDANEQVKEYRYKLIESIAQIIVGIN